MRMVSAFVFTQALDNFVWSHATAVSHEGLVDVLCNIKELWEAWRKTNAHGNGWKMGQGQGGNRFSDGVGATVILVPLIKKQFLV